jgi:hypothetical protein
MERPDREAWLYMRDDEAIRILRSSSGPMFLVCGPGTAEHAHTFDSSATLADFLRWYMERLEVDGWVLQAFTDRRVAKSRFPLPALDRRRCGSASPPA